MSELRSLLLFELLPPLHFLRCLAYSFEEFNESVSVWLRVLHGECVGGDPGVSQLAPLVLELLAQVVVLEEVDNRNRVHDVAVHRVGERVVAGLAPELLLLQLYLF